MKLSSILSLAPLLLAASATPSGADFSLVGFGKDNPIGPTTGGKGGETVTVTTPEALVAAVTDDVPRIVYAKGKFNLTSRLRVGSHKSLLGWGRVSRPLLVVEICPNHTE